MQGREKRRTILKALLVVPVLLHRSFGQEAEVSGPKAPPAFEPGEKLHYSLGWQFLTVGSATLEVLPDTELNGKPVRSFLLTARTRKSIDHLFKVRDRLSSLTELDLSRSLRFEKKQREGKTKRDVVVTYDEAGKTAFYEEKLKGKKQETIILPGSQDPLSAFYFVRMQELEVGKVIKGPFTDGKKSKMALVKVAARERKKVNGRKYDTFKLLPDLKDMGGVFEKSKKAKLEIWVTADHRHIPVMMKSKVAVGSFTCELIPAETKPESK
ncbi:DUF3108 domain-containing protein [Pontiella sulfatireligans]|uniref:DUF3108 domain-containing protein n=1 Tax=Pontiella sulfatireligans TaxID=2750658 RepID=A0A6C2ULA0_9BACT|nr:DUF3108 domain-containing protein [Pontiella sulfatireligans]VGO21010.1 hypothetical protein SCARR_03079 [Pontiella sulfatireligans]